MMSSGGLVVEGERRETVLASRSFPLHNEKAGRFCWFGCAGQGECGSGAGLIAARAHTLWHSVTLQCRPSLGQPSPNRFAPAKKANSCVAVHRPHNWGIARRLGLDHLRRGHQKIPTTTRQTLRSPNDHPFDVILSELTANFTTNYHEGPLLQSGHRTAIQNV